ncbi:transmembrane protein 241-like [Plakobranchus ocellatus]|uniref:Transmembrane protein 241-like n=1 Tax=Plakobranchus ocellatus TaxID=259542 RepID=A0AAV4BUA6_9GAST|nr:transmembrane protein 241-like [Plakobranchus ocellatus]
MFRALLSTGHIDGLLHGKEWHECALWLPGMMFFLISIYSGSKSLATLPLPVFLAMQNMALVFRATADLIFHQQIVTAYTYVMMMLTLCSGLAIAKTDPQFEPDGYFWMCVHIVSLGVFDIYTNLMKGRLKLRPTERLFCCYFYSVIVLAPCSYFLGDALEAATFPYLYFGQFYVGCILSGVLGMLMNLCAIRLHEANISHSFLDIATVQSIAKNHSKSDQNLDSTVSWASDKELPPGLKRHELQQDMIRLEMS